MLIVEMFVPYTHDIRLENIFVENNMKVKNIIHLIFRVLKNVLCVIQCEGIVFATIRMIIYLLPLRALFSLVFF